jgi:streptogramin lyase
MSCNTTAGQNILLGAISPFPGDVTNYDAFPLPNLESSGRNFNMSRLDQYWFQVAYNVLSQFAPQGLTAMLLPSIVSNNLTSLRIEFFGKP